MTANRLDRASPPYTAIWSGPQIGAAGGGIVTGRYRDSRSSYARCKSWSAPLPNWACLRQVSYVQRSGSSGLYEVLDLLLEKGLVPDVFARVAASKTREALEGDKEAIFGSE